MSNDLPLEIFMEILLWLPAESVFRFRSVSKGWRAVIDDPSFWRAHTFDYRLSSPSSHTTLVIKTKRDAHLFTLDDSDLFTDQKVSGLSLGLTPTESRSDLPRFPVSACNGLLLVYPLTSYPYSFKPQFEIWNPTTHERLQLPPIETNRPYPIVLFGLGYDHAAQDLKAVAMSRQQTHVYSLRSDAWTTTIIGDCLGSSTDSLWSQESHGFFLCGALHWLFYYKNKIVALDLGTLKIRHIHLVSLPETLSVNRKIDVVGGCLAVSAYSTTCCPQIFQVWVMKGYGSADESWVKLLSTNRVAPTFSFHDGLRPVAYFKDKKHVLLIDGPASGFFLFNVESDSMKRVCFDGLNGDKYAQIIPRSFFRLREHCGGGTGTSKILPFCPRKTKLHLRTYSC